jgi:hypothetical protein
MIAAVLAANLATIGFAVAVWKSEKSGGFDQPWIVWAGLILPLVFIVFAFFATGDLPQRLGG